MISKKITAFVIAFVLFELSTQSNAAFAQLKTESNRVSTNVGSPPPTNTPTPSPTQTPGGGTTPSRTPPPSGGVPNTGIGSPTRCSGTIVSFAAEKKLLPLPNQDNCSRTQTGACGRPGNCIVPNKIVLHITAGGTDANSIYSYFAGGSANGGVLYGVGSHFVIGKDGKVIQMVEMLEKEVEVAYAVANYGDHISIEMVSSSVYRDRNAVSDAQHAATMSLVRDLMSQYNIPIGNLEFDWKSNTDKYNSAAVPGVYGHYQLNPSTRTDPGIGYMRDFRNELKSP